MLHVLRHGSKRSDTMLFNNLVSQSRGGTFTKYSGKISPDSDQRVIFKGIPVYLRVTDLETTKVGVNTPTYSAAFMGKATFDPSNSPYYGNSFSFVDDHTLRIKNSGATSSYYYAFWALE